MNLKVCTRLILGAAVAILVVALGVVVWAYQARSQGVRQSSLGRWDECRRSLEHYLWLRPNDDAANLLVAEAYVRDEDLLIGDAVSKAARCLQRIPDHSRLGSEARAKEARVRFLLLHQPYQAEKLFRRALELEPESEENWYLLWRILELTGRFDQSSPVFWKLYEATPNEHKAIRLRGWYMCQFFPMIAASDFDRTLGILKEGETPLPLTEHKRLLEFRRREPASATGLAAVARWFLFEGDPQFALRLLEDRDSLEAPFDDPFYVSSLVNVLFQLGQLDRAADLFERWPGTRDGAQYWKLRGMLYDEYYGDDAEAVHSYEMALSDWPGPVDWRTRSRMAHCLARLKKPDDARVVRNSAKDIQDLLDEKVHERVRLALDDLGNAEQLQGLIKFYEDLHCPREAQAWSEHVARLRSERPASKDARRLTLENSALPDVPFRDNGGPEQRKPE